MANKKQGKALESLVLNLEKALAKNPNVAVHPHKRLRDRITGKLREHDVVLELKEGHHSLLIAIECRDRSRPIGVPQVEGFRSKCQDTGISQGVLVSTTGFCNTARKKADFYGIRCLDIEEVESFEWLLAPGIWVTTTHLLSNSWTFFPVEDGVIEGNDFEIIDSDGNVATRATLTANAQEQLTKLLPKIPQPTEGEEIKVKFQGNGLHLRSKISRKTVPVKFAVAKLQYSIKQELVPFRLVQYQEKDNDEHITDAAYADIKLDEKEVRLMIVSKDEGGGGVFLFPTK